MSQQKAFTLIELLIVIVVISILSGFIAVQLNNSVNAGKDVKRKSDIELLANAVTTYSSENYALKPITGENGCTIGGGDVATRCSSVVEDFLKKYLTNLPTDPNPETYYYYISTDGKSCQIYAKLSTPAPNDIYAYNCDTDNYTIGTIVNGACGDFSEYTSTNGYNNSSATDWPTITATSFCSAGTLDGTTPVFPEEGASVSWTCDGDRGDRAFCSAYRALNGVCGSADGTNSYTTPTTDLCSAGIASSVSGSGPWTWTCAGVNDGTTSETCTANKSVDGVCGSADGSYYSSVPTTDLCSAGIASSVSGSGPWTWTCAGVNDGTTSETCTALKLSPPIICNNVHTLNECTSAGGTLTWVSSCYVCKFSWSVTTDIGTQVDGLYPDCPSGWTQYQNWTTTADRSIYGGYCGSTTHNSHAGYSIPYTAGSHSWSNHAIESMPYMTGDNYNWACCTGCGSTACDNCGSLIYEGCMDYPNHNCHAYITARGCY